MLKKEQMFGRIEFRKYWVFRLGWSPNMGKSKIFEVSTFMEQSFD